MILIRRLNKSTIFINADNTQAGNFSALPDSIVLHKNLALQIIKLSIINRSGKDKRYFISTWFWKAEEKKLRNIDAVFEDLVSFVILLDFFVKISLRADS